MLCMSRYNMPSYMCLETMYLMYYKDIQGACIVDLRGIFLHPLFIFIQVADVGQPLLCSSSFRLHMNFSMHNFFVVVDLLFCSICRNHFVILLQ